MEADISRGVRTVRDAELSIRVPRQTPVGRPAELTIVLRNTGKMPVFWGRINGYRDCRTHVFDSAGKPVPLTPFGESVIGGDPGTRFKYNPKRLDPGQSQTWRFDLAKLFQLKPGGYTVSVSTVLNVPHDFKVGVEGVPFRIVE